MLHRMLTQCSHRKLDEPDKANSEGETPLELTRIYLSCLHTHFINVLEKRLSPWVVHSTPMDFIVTVPAIWSNAAKQATERAAAMAGFCGNQRIQLISEPVRHSLESINMVVKSVNENPGSRSVVYYKAPEPVRVTTRSKVCRVRCRWRNSRPHILRSGSSAETRGQGSNRGHRR
jgi:hypothetical protein